MEVLLCLDPALWHDPCEYFFLYNNSWTQCSRIFFSVGEILHIKGYRSCVALVSTAATPSMTDRSPAKKDWRAEQLRRCETFCQWFLGVSWEINDELVAVQHTPRKINMEPKNTPLEKEKTASKPSFSGSLLIFRGVCFFPQTFIYGGMDFHKEVGELQLIQNHIVAYFLFLCFCHPIWSTDYEVVATHVVWKCQLGTIFTEHV